MIHEVQSRTTPIKGLMTQCKSDFRSLFKEERLPIFWLDRDQIGYIWGIWDVSTLNPKP